MNVQSCFVVPRLTQVGRPDVLPLGRAGPQATHLRCQVSLLGGIGCYFSLLKPVWNGTKYIYSNNIALNFDINTLCKYFHFLLLSASAIVHLFNGINYLTI